VEVAHLGLIMGMERLLHFRTCLGREPGAGGELHTTTAAQLGQILDLSQYIGGAIRAGPVQASAMAMATTTMAATIEWPGERVSGSPTCQVFLAGFLALAKGEIPGGTMITTGDGDSEETFTGCWINYKYDEIWKKKEI